MKKIFQTVIFLLLTNLAFSQCGNTDFELGNFTGWTGKRGNCCPIVLPNNGIVNNRQTIMTQGLDPHSCGGLNRVYSGTYSARLGNDLVGRQAEGLYYNFVVTPQTTIIRYAYAVVFQDPSHALVDQPRFQSRVRLSNGQIINCTDYQVTASSNLPGFRYCNELDINGNPVQVAYKDWSVVAIDLSGYVGQSVTLEFETGDCDLGAHFGYAYIDAVECGQIDTYVPYCEGDDSTTITASNGFSSYLWNTGDSTQSITIDPSLYDTLICEVTTFTGCVLKLKYILNVEPGLPSFTFTPTCAGLVQFTNTSSASYSPITYLWNFGDGFTTNVQNPTHLFSAGIYNVNLQISSSLGCSRDTTIPVQIFPTPNPKFTVPDLCLGNQAVFTNTTPPTGYPISYYWNFGDGTNSTQISPTHNYINAGTYLVSLSASTTGTPCLDTFSSQITIYDLPTISDIIIN